MNWLEILGTVIGLIYLWLEYKASIWLWAASIAMPAVYLYVYLRAGLYADFAINIYYLLASVYGLICWLGHLKADKDSGIRERNIDHTPKKMLLPLILTSGVLFLMIGLSLRIFTDSTVPWADGFTTALSIVALWMLAKKYVEQWLVWMIVDICCCVLYMYKDLWFTGCLYGLYAIIAIAGYREWLRIMNNGTQIKDEKN